MDSLGKENGTEQGTNRRASLEKRTRSMYVRLGGPYLVLDFGARDDVRHDVREDVHQSLRGAEELRERVSRISGLIHRGLQRRQIGFTVDVAVAVATRLLPLRKLRGAEADS